MTKPITKQINALTNEMRVKVAITSLMQKLWEPSG